MMSCFYNKVTITSFSFTKGSSVQAMPENKVVNSWTLSIGFVGTTLCLARPLPFGKGLFCVFMIFADGRGETTYYRRDYRWMYRCY